MADLSWRRSELTVRGFRRAVGISAGLLALVGPAVLVGSANAQEPVKYVAVGDSFAAGAGMRPVQGTPGSESCSRYQRNYPSIIAADTGWQLTDVTCSAAGIENSWDNSQYPEVPSQKEAITADTDLVTFQFGGNDSRLSVAFKTCLEQRIGKPAEEGPSCEDLNASSWNPIDFARLEQRIPRVLQEIRERAPHARVAVIGYPAVLPEDSSQCPYVANPYPGAPGVGPMRAADIDWFRGQFRTMNATIQQLAEANGAQFVDTYTPFIGHDACQVNPVGVEQPKKRWIAGVLAAEPGLPGLEPLWAAAHPNRTGHEMLAGFIREDLGSRP